MKNLITVLFVFGILSNSIGQSAATTGNTFWLAYMENISLVFNLQPDFSIFVSGPESGTATITAPATGLSFSFEYEANTETEFKFPPGIFYAQGSEAIENFGFRINTTTETSVFAIHHRLFFSEASIVLPDKILSDEYLISACEDFDGAFDSPSCFVVVATEDNTQIEISLTNTSIGLRPADVPFIITLNEGQSYQLQALKDLTGSRVKALNSDKIAVFAGAVRSDLDCSSTADNHLYDQLFPMSYGGQSFALIPFKNQGISIFKILASENNTAIFINDSLITTLQASEFIELTYNEPKILESEKNVFVTQFNPSQSCTESFYGDPTMLQLHSIEYLLKSRSFFSPTGVEEPSTRFGRQHLTIFSKNKDVNEIFYNGENIIDSFIEFPNNRSYKYATIDVAIGSGKLDAPKGAMAYAYGFGPFDAYSYSLGFDKEESVSTTTLPSILKLKLYPNPVMEDVFISAAEVINRIEVFDLNGRSIKLLQPLNKECSVNLAHFPAGVYFLRINSKNAQETKRVVKF